MTRCEAQSYEERNDIFGIMDDKRKRYRAKHTKARDKEKRACRQTVGKLNELSNISGHRSIVFSTATKYFSSSMSTKITEPFMTHLRCLVKLLNSLAMLIH